MLNHKLKSIAAIVSTVTMLVVGLVTAPIAAQAVGNANLFWIGSDSGSTQRVYSGNTATTPITPTALTTTVAANVPNRGIGSDGTYIYFADTTGTKLVRTNLDGTNRTVVATITAGLQGIAVSGGYVYWTSWSGGVFGVAANASNGTPTTLYASSTNGLPGSGFGGIAVSGSNMYLAIYDGSSLASLTAGVGLYKVTISGLVASGLTKNTDVSGFASANPGLGITTDGTTLYMSTRESSRKGVLTTADWTQPIANWSLLNTSSQTSNPGGISVLGGDVFVTDGANGKVYSMTTAGAGLAQIFGGSGLTTGFQIVAVSPPSYTVTFDANGGTGTMAAQTSSVAANLTANAFTKADHVFGYWSLTSVCSFAYNDAASYPFTSNTTLYACWRGAGQFSETLNGTAVSTYGFGTTNVGSTVTKNMFFKNIGDSNSLSGTISNSSLSTGVGLSVVGAANGATPACNFSGGSLNYGQSCAFTITWNPSSAMTLTTGSHSFTPQFNGAFFNLTFSGSAVNTKTVTFDPNVGVGTMAAQVDWTTANLTANSFARSGYNFTGWNTAANGTGTAYLDGATYSFASNITLYAQWAPAATGGVDSSIVRLGPVLDKTVTPDSKTVTLTGFNLDKVTQVLINGTAATFSANGASQITINLPALSVGQSVQLDIVAANARISMVGAFRVVSAAAVGSGTGGNTGSGSSNATFAVYFAPGSSALTAKAKAALAVQLAALKAAASSIVVEGWAQDTGNNAGDRKLSAARSAAVIAWLKAHGVKAAAATARGTLDTSASSRRVDVTYLTK